MTDRVERAARKLLEDHEAGDRFTNVARAFGVDDLAGAYDTQDRFRALLGDRHGAPMGYKIGLTSKAMQEMCNIDQPICGVIHSGRLAQPGGTVSLADRGRTGVEFEIAVRMDADLGGAGETVTIDDVPQAVDAVAPAFEFIDDRGADYGSLDVLSLIADNSWSAGGVIGEFVAPPEDLAAVRGTVELNGELLDQGLGSAALGHPYEPVAWLANHLASRGATLRRGDIVLTGSLVRTQFPAARDSYTFAVDAIGTVSIGFSA